MMKTTIVTLCLFFLVENSLQRSTLDSTSYVAAVVEFSPSNPKSAEESPIQINAARYVSFIEQAAKQNVDIIVFPEAGLTSIHEPGRNGLEAWATLVPAPAANYLPCINSMIPVSESLKVLSCAARENMIYVLVNLIEKVICINEKCPTDKRFYYNTNVVFDPDGKIIARYRKTHLYIEPGFDVPAIPEFVTFDTEFGVTFGTFICFDVLFKKPALYLTRMFNVTDFVYSTAWFSEVPFLTAVQTQAGWSYAEDVNFLVSGYNRPAYGNSGSGIYLGRKGIARAIIPNSTTNEMLISVVPKIIRSSSWQSRPRYNYNIEEVSKSIQGEEIHVHDEFRKRRSAKSDEEKELPIEIGKNETKEELLSLFHENLTLYKSYLFNSSIEQTICDGNFCCNFSVDLRTRNDQETFYRMVAYDGTRKFGPSDIAGIRVCAIVSCSNETIDSCGSLERTKTTFNALEINVTFPNFEDIIVMPSSIDTDLRPLADWGYVENWEDKKLQISANLARPTSDLVTCGIYARDFSRDSKIGENDATIGMQWATLTALALVSLFLVFLYRKGWRKPWQRDNQLSSEHGPYQNLRTK